MQPRVGRGWDGVSNRPTLADLFGHYGLRLSYSGCEVAEQVVQHASYLPPGHVAKGVEGGEIYPGQQFLLWAPPHPRPQAQTQRRQHRR